MKILKKFLMGIGLLFFVNSIVNLIMCFFVKWGISIDSIFLLYFLSGCSCGYILNKLYEKEKDE